MVLLEHELVEALVEGPEQAIEPAVSVDVKIDGEVGALCVRAIVPAVSGRVNTELL